MHACMAYIWSGAKECSTAAQRAATYNPHGPSLRPKQWQEKLNVLMEKLPQEKRLPSSTEQRKESDSEDERAEGESVAKEKPEKKNDHGPK